MRQAIGYIRVSTDDQVENGVSLEAQVAKIQAQCTVKDWELTEVYSDEGISGHRMDREGLLAARQAVCACKGVLIVYSLSRLARNTKGTIELMDTLSKAGADLVSLSEDINTTSAAGKMVFRMMATLAEFERDQVSERTTMALAYKKSKGERVGTITIGKKELNGVLINDDHEQAAISLAKHYRAEGLGLLKIANILADKGYFSRKGTTYSATTIATMVA